MLSTETMNRLMLAYNTGHLFDSDEFQEDAQRIVLVAKLIDRWLAGKLCNYRLIVNHIVIIENTFGETGVFALYEYISNFQKCIPSLLAVLYFMNRIHEPAIYDIDLLKELEALDNE